MFDDARAFVTRAFLQAGLDLEYRAYSDEADDVLRARLAAWSQRLQLKETSAEGAFVQTFFVETWGYGEAGRVGRDEVTLIPKFRIAGEGAGGGMGEADLALGWFRDNPREIPQVLCEFKDIRSNLDARQNRKGSTRSPIEQCLNYVRGARRGLFGNEPVQPWWGLVTDMNEFRLYWWDRGKAEYLRFVISTPRDLLTPHDLLSLSKDARFDRFLFWKLFQRDELLSVGGRPPLLRLIERQWVRERQLEGEFYDRYKAVRERLFNVLRLNNPSYPGTPTELLRLTQKLLDRFIFAFYCEDMGERMLFPPELIRDHLKGRSTEPFYDPRGDELWAFFKRLFASMNVGGAMGKINVPHINGGLFASDAQIENLNIPNHVFAAAGQGASEAALERDSDTLLYLCARYNYASRGEARESLSLYTLGRIFEQSITELEYRAGELEGRQSLASLSKRKRDGVFYTPEKIVNYLVSETLNPWFDAAKVECGWPAADGAFPELAQIESYELRLKRLRLVDPACGSGAFLISAFRRLLEERIAVEHEKARVAGRPKGLRVDEARLTSEILSENIYGVDINPASVEIAKLALWLHSARADSPLSSLDRTLRCFNSLVGPEYWVGRTADQVRKDRVNAITTWRDAFPEVWPEGQPGGFDIVLGNPPYVKLQNVRTLDPEVPEWLQAERGDDTYRSAQSGNFDLYLPFIEKGLRLLAPGGRMAYIAPSLWTVNEYGHGLRRLVRDSGQLDRWVDFKAYQVFEEAITYTALQFFTHDRQNVVRIAAAPDGALEDIGWSNPDLAVAYAELPEHRPWLMATGAERALIDRLAQTCLRLDDRTLTAGIVVGIQTSADHIYHLERLGRGRYRVHPPKAPAYEVEVEDEIMRPLISGPEAKRYEEPETNTYLLFPYERDAGGRIRLIPEADLERRFPKAWAYLKSWQKELRAREKAAFDDDSWWRFGRNQNLDKQDLRKLIVAQTVPHMRVCADTHADKYLNNVRVNGILASNDTDPFYLLGVLNGAVADFVFQRIGKPKIGGYFEANKQFIAPLPVPSASFEQSQIIAEMARSLQNGWTRRRELIAAARERLGVLARARHNERWLWPNLPDHAVLQAEAPPTLMVAGDRRDWANARFAEALAVRIERLDAVLGVTDRLKAEFRNGELMLFADGAAVLNRIYLDERPGRLAESYWQWLLLSRSWRDAAVFAKELCRVPSDQDTAAARQFVTYVAELEEQVAKLADDEAQMNEHLFALYGLSADERALIESAGASRRAGSNQG